MFSPVCIRPIQFLILLFLTYTGIAAAHDIPSDATIRVFVKPSGDRLQLLVRVPLRAVRDLDFPETKTGYLDVEKLSSLLPNAATSWISDFIELFEGQAMLPRPKVALTQISIESDRSFASYKDALAQLNGPKLDNNANVVWNQVLFDVLLEYPIRSDQSAFSIRSKLEQLATRVVTVLRFLPPNGVERAYEFTGDPGRIALDPRWHQAARRFIELGFLHILDGADHLLFLLCLVIPFRQLRGLIPVVTAFTAAHSITLIASAYNVGPDGIWFPPLIETLIAVSIVYMALENIASTSAMHRRWIIAFGFGLVHGFGFSFALRETLQFAGSHLLSSLLWFNIGIELGQILVLLLLIPVLEACFRFVVAERIGTIIISAFVAHTAWHWTIERWDHLRQFNFQAPDLRAALLAGTMRWALLILIFIGIIWTFRWLWQRSSQRVQNDDDLKPQID